MAIADRDPSELMLWAHQHRAVRACETYFASLSTRGCLVHMPTGSGKTGVMAVLASRRAAAKPVLVVCPSAALVEQLRSEFLTDFWSRIDADPVWRPDRVLQALPGSIDELVTQLREAVGERIIMVGTIQAVQQVHSAGDGEQLRGHIGTIIFDEGHREPAPLWEHLARARRLSPLEPLAFLHWASTAVGYFFAGRYEEPLEATERSLSERGDFPPALRIKIACCGLLGRIDEGRECLERLVRVNPGTTMATLKAYYEPLTRHHPRSFETYLKGFRLCGVPYGEIS